MARDVLVYTIMIVTVLSGLPYITRGDTENQDGMGNGGRKTPQRVYCLARAGSGQSRCLTSVTRLPCSLKSTRLM